MPLRLGRGRGELVVESTPTGKRPTGIVPVTLLVAPSITDMVLSWALRRIRRAGPVVHSREGLGAGRQDRWREL